MRLIERLEWDYAPDLNHYVKRSSIDNFRATRTNIELVAAISGPAANRRRLAAIVRAERQKQLQPDAGTANKLTEGYCSTGPRLGP